MGDIFVLRREPDAARSYYEKAVSLDPKSPYNHVRLGQLAESKSDWDGAIGEYKKAVDLDSSNGIAKNNLAWLYAEHGGDLNAAFSLAEEARQLLPENPNTADTLGWILIKKDLAPSAVPYLTECVSKQPNNPGYHYHLGLAYFRIGQKEKAKRELEAALHLKPDFSAAEDAKNMLSQIITPSGK